MSVNHHLLAKTTTDSILANFKSGSWDCCTGIGKDFYRVGCNSTFPSPDAAFYEDKNKLLVTFEFKPPTETKRGILTGLGQSIAYLNSSNLSYLIAPQMLEDFNLGVYMTDLYQNQIENNLPVGLILYDNNIPSKVSLIHNVNALTKTKIFSSVSTGRFWAKHQDMPIPLFHLILHCYYQKKVGAISGDAFAFCWDNFLVPKIVLKKLTPSLVMDLKGDVIRTLSGRKNIAFLEKKLAEIKKLTGSPKGKAIASLRRDVDSAFIGDNNYNSTKKNFVTFLKHIGVIDSNGAITEEGFKLYHLGLINGPNSKIFIDYFTKIVLITGNHLDLIFDLDNFFNKYRGTYSLKKILSLMHTDYEAKGMIKRNPKRTVGITSSVEFLKYEFILWNSLGLIVKTTGKPEISFNWKKITEVCSMPDL